LAAGGGPAVFFGQAERGVETGTFTGCKGTEGRKKK